MDMVSARSDSSVLDLVKQYTGDLHEFKHLIKQNQINLALLAIFLVIIYRQFQERQVKAASAGKDWLEAPGFPDIKGLPNFHWQNEEPQKIRPFKPKYYLTMALQNLDPSELILMDKNYADRIAYRKRIMRENPGLSIGVADDQRIGSAVRELYTYLLGTYLPKRFPEMFKLHYASFETGAQFMFENQVTKEVYPVATSSLSRTDTLLLTLGKTLDEDFLLLLPEQDAEDAKYVLEAFVTCCPSGFDTSKKLGQKLAAIHEPVPGYAEKLAGSMDKYFNTIEVGKYVKRANWAITTHGELFVPGDGKYTNHAKEGETTEPITSIVEDETFLRVERQTLHRLPTSKALVFAFKTYLYPLRQIKEEGLGEDLAQAIDGMKNGNVPQMHIYKRGAEWGEAVKRYLRS